MIVRGVRRKDDARRSGSGTFSGPKNAIDAFQSADCVLMPSTAPGDHQDSHPFAGCQGCAYIFIHTSTYVHISIYVHIHIRIYTHIRMYYTYICIHKHKHVHVHIHAHVHVQIHIHIYV